MSRTTVGENLHIEGIHLHGSYQRALLSDKALHYVRPRLKTPNASAFGKISSICFCFLSTVKKTYSDLSFSFFKSISLPVASDLNNKSVLYFYQDA
jgi:hypothetical protein